MARLSEVVRQQTAVNDQGAVVIDLEQWHHKDPEPAQSVELSEPDFVSQTNQPVKKRRRSRVGSNKPSSTSNGDLESEIRNGNSDLWGMAEEELLNIGGLVQQNKPFPMEAITTISAGIVESLGQSQDIMLRVFSPPHNNPGVVSNSINVAILATKLGMGLDYQSEDLKRLALAGLLHDIGKFLLPESLMTKSGEIDANDQALLKQHPELGFKIISEFGEEYIWLADVVRQEHERWGGQGYPKGMKGEKIHEFAQIIGLADTFETMVNASPDQPKYVPHDAIRILLTTQKSAFAGKLLKALVEQVSLFPVGSIVRLSTGEIATVQLTNSRHPLRPVVQISSPSNRPGQQETIVRDLSKHSLIHIVQVV